MIRLKEIRTIERPLDEVFAYVSDFSNTEEWDPGVTSGRRLDDGPVSLGSKFDIVATFAGREVPLVYEVTALEPPRKIVLEAGTKQFSAVDTIEFAAVDDDRTDVIYSADFELKGLLRFVEILMRPLFNQLATKAMNGLKKTLG